MGYNGTSALKPVASRVPRRRPQQLQFNRVVRVLDDVSSKSVPGAQELGVFVDLVLKGSEMLGPKGVGPALATQVDSVRRGYRPPNALGRLSNHPLCRPYRLARLFRGSCGLCRRCGTHKKQENGRYQEDAHGQPEERRRPPAAHRWLPS